MRLNAQTAKDDCQIVAAIADAYSVCMLRAFAARRVDVHDPIKSAVLCDNEQPSEQFLVQSTAVMHASLHDLVVSADSIGLRLPREDSIEHKSPLGRDSGTMHPTDGIARTVCHTNAHRPGSLAAMMVDAIG